jgi:hypothetical protein
VRFDLPEDEPTAPGAVEEAASADREPPRAGPGDAELGAIVSRLARRHPSGRRVVERAALLAEGADFAALLAWIEAHDGVAEDVAPRTRAGGLFGGRDQQPAGPPLRFVLPPSAFA